MQKLTLNSAWWLRKEELNGCVEQVDTTFKLLGELHAIWQDWFVSLDKPDLKLSDNPSLIHTQLIQSFAPESGIQRDPDLGYSLRALSKPHSEAITGHSMFWVRCCSRTKFSGYNTLSVELPEPERVPDLYRVSILGRAIRVLVEVWDPDWLIVWDLRTHLPWRWPPRPALGWINYIAHRTGRLPSVLPTRWEWFDDRGDKQIFIYTDGPPDANNPDHVSAFNSMGSSIVWKEPSEP
jgi:hypothetical protein